MRYKILTASLSDIGYVRQNNEDAYGQLTEEQFFVLADGMGGHKAGEIAAKKAVELLCLFFKDKNIGQKSLEDTQQVLKDAIRHVNRMIYQMGCRDDDLGGMGTTLCCILLHPEGLIYAHVGDSRIYRFRHKRLKQLTQDHSLLRELIDLGQLSPKEARSFQYKNIITKAIGTEPTVEPTVKTDTIEKGDILLLCSDGLTDMLTDEEIEDIIAETPEKDIAKKLVQAAKAQGGVDNITVSVVNVQDRL